VWNSVNTFACAGFEIPTMVVMKSSIFWDITLRSPLKVNRRFGGIFRQGLLPSPRWFLAWLIIRPWRWRRNVPPKRRFTFNGLHGVIFQKIEHFWLCYSYCNDLPYLFPCVFYSVLTPEIQIMVFWVMTLFSLVRGCKRFGEAYCLRLQDKVSQV
jgi:hypothetical protein